MKSHLTSCPTRDRNFNKCGRKGQFANHCRSAARKQTNIVDQNTKLSEQETYRANPQDNPEFEVHPEDVLTLAGGRQ